LGCKHDGPAATAGHEEGRIRHVAGAGVDDQQHPVILHVHEREVAAIRGISGIRLATGQRRNPPGGARRQIGREQAFLVRKPGAPGDLGAIRRPGGIPVVPVGIGQLSQLTNAAGIEGKQPQA
jgi:hypothetical protein